MSKENVLMTHQTNQKEVSMTLFSYFETFAVLWEDRLQT